ncbi:MAG: SMP-30/gluconolactonase/LRE family protein [Elusimicrobiota bacterium]
MRPTFLAALLVVLVAAADARAYDFIEFADPIDAGMSAHAVAAAASPSRLYLVDEKKSALHIFDAEGKHLKTVFGKDLLSGPRGIALGPSGEVFVADTKNSRVQVFDPEGALKRSIGSKGSAPGRLSKPHSVAVGADGRVYVADTGNDRVQVFTREGVFLFGFGEKGSDPGQLKGPTRIAVDPSDRVYVLDEGNERLQRYGSDTSLDREFVLHGSDFAVDDYGFLYMLDKKRGKVKEVGPDGLVRGGFGAAGKGRGQFKKPQGIAIGPDGTIFVVDAGNKRIQRVLLTNKLKTERLKHNLATKLLVTGPTRVLPLAAAALASSGELLIAYEEKTGQFVVIGKDGAEVRRFGTNKGSDETVTEGTRGFAASEKYGLYVADTKGGKIQVFGLDGEHKTNFGEAKGLFASKKKEGRVKEPAGVAIDEKGKVYVADAGNRRVDAFSPDGTFLFGFGPRVGPHEFDRPVSVAWDEAGFVYVLDSGLRKVFKCTPSGGFIKAWGAEGRGVGQFDDPVSLAYDGRSYLYVLDRGHKRVSVFDRDGTWVTNFFSGGSDELSLDEPSALTVTGDQLVIADPRAGRVVSFTLHPRLAPPVEISTKAVEGEVVVSWKPVSDPWAGGYRVYRSSRPLGPFGEGLLAKKPVFKDSKVEAYERYWYRVAVEAGTGDLGPVSRPVEVYIPGAFNRPPIEISTLAVGNIFSANYKWYLTNPVGKAAIVNNVNLPFQNVKASFRLKDFMDFATEKVIERIGAQETVEIPLVATLNNRILEVSEDTPIQAEFTVTYYEKGKKQEVSVALPLKVYSRNAITWEDPRRIANFITPKDPPVLDLGREILRQAPEGPQGTAYLNGNLATAMRLWAALGSLGVKFMPSPNNPFELMSEDPAFPVDYTQFPRETLRRKSGECDDLVTLIASMLEGATVRTALLDYPGHLALMFDTGSNDLLEVGLPEDKLIKYQDTYWVPLEATMVGSPFEESSSKALFAYKEMAAQDKAAVTDPRESWKVYEPATLPKPEQEALKPEAKDFAKRFDRAASHYLKARYAFLSAHLQKAAAEAEGDPAPLNQLGILESQHGRLAEAEKEFAKALEAEPGNAAALNNMGNLAYVRGDYEAALTRYQEAAERDADDPGIWMNLTRAALKLGRKERADEYAKKAVALDKTLKPDVESLMKR